jgi:hypothetical protein
VVIDNCLAGFNREGGILVEGWHQTGNHNIVIKRCTAYGNDGLGGIYFNGGQNALIEHCRSYGNKFLNLWIWNANNTTIRWCETARGYGPDEAGGFDVDFSCNACTVEYCYSHHNEGYGFMLMGAGHNFSMAPTESRYDLIRHCVAAEDGKPIWVIETFDHGLVYGNGCSARGRNRSALEVSGWPESKNDGGWPSACRFSGNTCVGLDGAAPLWVDENASQQGNVFDGDTLAGLPARTGALVARWGGGYASHRLPGQDPWKENPPRDYTDLASFQRATGQEKRGNTPDPESPPAFRPDMGRPARILRRGPTRETGLDAVWLKGRSRYLQETGAEVFGISMDPLPTP